MDETPEKKIPVDQTESVNLVKSAVIEEIYFWATAGSIAHWRTSYKFKETTEDLIGMSFDMYQPEGHVYHPTDTGNSYGSLMIRTTEEKLVSTRPAVVQIIPLKKRITVADLLSNLIYPHGLQFYIFHPDGSGCMFWQLNLLRLMIEKGWIESDEKEKAEHAIQAYRNVSTANANKMPWPPRQGTFYSPPSPA